MLLRTIKIKLKELDKKYNVNVEITDIPSVFLQQIEARKWE